ncbi:MAG: lipoprotein [Lachnospiraceae bacterium]|jgi:hypothetical protein
MKKMIAILLAIAMLLSLTACGGGEPDPNAGKYQGVSAKALGITMDMSEVYPGETWMELESGGKGTVMLDGDEYPMKWTLEGETITLTIEGVDSVGTLADGVITVDLMDMGVEMAFLKEGAEMPAEESESEAEEEMTSATESSEMPVTEATYNDAGYWEIVRMESEDPESAISEEDMAYVKSAGVLMYMELNADGTGAMYMEDEMPLTWTDGAITFTEEKMTVSYTLENGEMKLDMIETVLVLRKGEKPEPVVSEMEQAGFTYFMEVGEPYAFANQCADNTDLDTLGEATVVSYEIFESADGYEPLEGYEWHTATIEIRFNDDNAWEYGIDGILMCYEDYYNTKLLNDTYELVEETDTYDKYRYTIVHNGQETDAYFLEKEGTWGDWYVNEDGNNECIFTKLIDFLVPTGYDGCVTGFVNSRVEWPDDAYITDLNPDDFLMFRLN